MKKIRLFLPLVLLLSCAERDPALVNGLMIDAARLLERQDYYYRLVDFMADWKMNTLLLHFSDDHGLSVAIPGYEKLARRQAFTPDDILRFTAYASERGIDVIPELEVFGHTRYITDHPDYAHLFLGDRSGTVSFNAIDPLNPESIALMTDMIAKTAELFPSGFLHIGCDEVNLAPLGINDREKKAQIWTDYVNIMINAVHKNGKMPMIWSDHLRKDELIAQNLRKDVVVVEWNYVPDYRPGNLNDLNEMGYYSIIMAPSISCYLTRVLPVRPALRNVEALAASVRDETAAGMINTLWLPMRYLQDAMWYGIAYSAWLIDKGRPMDLQAFHRHFVRKLFGRRPDRDLAYYLQRWPDLHLDYRIWTAFAQGRTDIAEDPRYREQVRSVYKLSSELSADPPAARPRRNAEILQSMYLATDVMQVFSEGLLILGGENFLPQEISEWRRRLAIVSDAVDADWDRGRYADDPAKEAAKFANQTSSHLLILLKIMADAADKQFPYAQITAENFAERPREE